MSTLFRRNEHLSIKVQQRSQGHTASFRFRQRAGLRAATKNRYEWHGLIVLFKAFCDCVKDKRPKYLALLIHRGYRTGAAMHELRAFEALGRLIIHTLVVSLLGCVGRSYRVHLPLLGSVNVHSDKHPVSGCSWCRGATAWHSRFLKLKTNPTCWSWRNTTHWQGLSCIGASHYSSEPLNFRSETQRKRDKFEFAIQYGRHHCQHWVKAVHAWSVFSVLIVKNTCCFVLSCANCHILFSERQVWVNNAKEYNWNVVNL